MEFVDRTLRWQRRTLAGVLVAAALVFHRGTFDVFNTTKATVIALGALAVAVIGAVRIARTRRVLLPVTPAWYAVGAFAAALTAATFVSPTPVWSVVGRPGRHTGLAMYLIYIGLFAVAARLYRNHSPGHLAKVLLLAAVPVAVYGLAQAGGIEPFGWDAIEGGPQVFATFGNANFFSAWLGIVTPLGVWAALARTLPPAWRAVGALVALLCLAAAVASGSLQGPASAVVGSLLVGGVWLFTGGGATRRWCRPLLTGGLVAAGALVGAFLAGAGPFASVRQGAEASLATRLPKWEAAMAMFRDRPVVGFGVDQYASWYYTYRPAAVAAQDGLERSVDSSHNVPLDMLVSGGLLLFVAYLAVIAVIGWALVVGLRRLEGSERMLLAGFGGAWTAYQVQAMVSIDVPPLAAMHWVLAGVVLAVGTRPHVREWTLPGAPAVPAARPGRKKKPRQSAPLASVHPAVVVALAGVVLAGAWVMTLPIRADASAMRGVQAAAAGDVRVATDSYRRAASLASWEPRYPAMLGGLLNQVGQADLAYDAYLEAAARDPRGLSHALNLGRVAVTLERPDAADRWYGRALEIDPTTPEVLAEVGRFELEQGDVAAANGLLERAVALRGDRPGWWAALGEARSADGDVQGAREAFERALELDPDTPDAVEGLERLAGDPQD